MDEKKKSKKKGKDLEKEIVELTSLLKRVQADFENFRKRSQKEREDFAKYSNTDLILRIIPAIDNFKLAFDHIPKELESDEWVHGIFHIRKQLEAILADEGVKEVETGGMFDHMLHEAVEVVPSLFPKDKITEVVATGYMLGDKLIRPAKVKVSSGSKEHGLRDHPKDTEC